MNIKWITVYKVLRRTPGTQKKKKQIRVSYCYFSGNEPPYTLQRSHTRASSPSTPLPREMSFGTALGSKGPQPPPLQIWLSWSYSFSLAENSSHILRQGKVFICCSKYTFFIKLKLENIQLSTLWVQRTSVYTWQILRNFLWLQLTKVIIQFLSVSIYMSEVGPVLEVAHYRGLDDVLSSLGTWLCSALTYVGFMHWQFLFLWSQCGCNSSRSHILVHKGKARFFLPKQNPGARFSLIEFDCMFNLGPVTLA